MKDEDYIFSKGFRKHMSALPDDMTGADLISSGEAMDHLLKWAMSDEERKDLWEKVGRPDCYNCGDLEDD